MIKITITAITVTAMSVGLLACTSVSQDQKPVAAKPMEAEVVKQAVADAGIPDMDLGLYKSSVYDDPTPDVVSYKGGDPGTNDLIGASYHTAPPMITHSVADMLPISQEMNLCKDCHVVPDMIGEKIDKGVPTPAPRSHYVAASNELYMGRWNCVQCHAPQADVKPLVASTFKQDK